MRGWFQDDMQAGKNQAFDLDEVEKAEVIRHYKNIRKQGKKAKGKRSKPKGKAQSDNERKGSENASLTPQPPGDKSTDLEESLQEVHKQRERLEAMAPGSPEQQFTSGHSLPSERPASPLLNRPCSDRLLRSTFHEILCDRELLDEASAVLRPPKRSPPPGFG